MEYVIIGNSAAAVGCIEGIRSVDRDGSVTVISDEPHRTYGRPLISYLLMGKTDFSHIGYRDDDFYEKNGVTTLLGRRAVSIDTQAHRVLLDDGESVAYDRLMVAAGSKPFLPPLTGLETVEKRFSFMTLDDALALEKVLTEETRVLILGAGLIGMKCAEGIADRVAQVDLCDLADHVLPSVLDTEAASMVQAEMERHHCRFHLGVSVRRFEGSRAELTDGTFLDYDVLVTAIGVRPNIELVEAAGGGTERGILTDAAGHTTLEDIYAAGDCVQCVDTVSGKSGVIAILPNAYRQGHAAGVTMAGGQETFDGAMAMNAGGFFDLHLVTAGVYDGDSVVRRDASGYRCLFVRNGVMRGFIIVGDISRAGIYTAMIRNHTPLDETDRERLFDAPQMLAYDAARRTALLGGDAV